MHAPILDGDHAPDDLAPDDPSWPAACAEFAGHIRRHAENMADENRAAAFIFIDTTGSVCDDVVILGDRAPLIAALRSMIAALEVSDVQA